MGNSTACHAEGAACCAEGDNTGSKGDILIPVVDHRPACVLPEDAADDLGQTIEQEIRFPHIAVAPQVPEEAAEAASECVDMESEAPEINVHTSTVTGMESGMLSSEQSTVSGRRKKQSGQVIQLCSAGSGVLKLVSFQEQTGLLRATRLSRVMHHGAAIFAQSKGSAQTYELSQEVSAIDVFISHNWSVGRAFKFACLALHFNFHQALCVTVVAVVIIAIATAQGFLPVVMFERGPPQTGVCLTLLVTPISLTMIGLGHEFRRLLPSPAVFLDKTCIHQTDKVVQRASILKLGAFIQCSSHFVIVYTDIYLKKLWTVYEVACFLSLHPTSRLAAIPPCMPMIVMGGIQAQYGAGVFALIFKVASGDGTHDPTGPLNLVSLGVGLLVCSLILRHVARIRESISQRVANFDVADCICACEEDRPLVYTNISLLMQATERVDADATDEDTLESFNCLVRKRLAGPLVGAVSMDYLKIFGILLCGQLPWELERALGSEGVEPRTRLALVLRTCCWDFGLGPSVAFFMVKLCGACLHFRGCRDQAYVAIGSFLMILVMVFLEDVLMTPLVLMSERQDAGLIALVLVLVLSTSTAIAAFAFDTDACRREGSQEIEEHDEIVGEDEEIC